MGKSTTTAQTKSKVASTEALENKQSTNEVDIDLKAENTQLKESLAAMQQQMAALMSTVSNIQAPQVIVTNTNNALSGKKVKVISLLPNWLNLSTEEKGQGKIYTFPEFGYERTIKFDDLENIIHACRRSAEEGEFYICDSDVVDALGLTEEYVKLNNKQSIVNILSLANHEAVELFIKMCSENDNGKLVVSRFQQSLARKIAENMTEGTIYDLNYLAEIQRKTGLDIQQMAEDMQSLKAPQE